MLLGVPAAFALGGHDAIESPVLGYGSLRCTCSVLLWFCLSALGSSVVLVQENSCWSPAQSRPLPNAVRPNVFNRCWSRALVWVPSSKALPFNGLRVHVRTWTNEKNNNNPTPKSKFWVMPIRLPATSKSPPP